MTKKAITADGRTLCSNCKARITFDSAQCWRCHENLDVIGLFQVVDPFEALVEEEALDEALEVVALIIVEPSPVSHVGLEERLPPLGEWSFNSATTASLSGGFDAHESGSRGLRIIRCVPFASTAYMRAEG